MKKLVTIFTLVLAFSFAANAQTIWSEDFGTGFTSIGGVPTGWSNVGSVAAAKWTYDTDGSNGGYATGTGPVQSLTPGNGFMIFDSDFLDEGSSTTQGSGAAPSPHTGNLITPAFSCVGFSVVHLKFYQYFRNFTATCNVGVSTNGGTSWTDFPVNASIATNASTPKNDSIEVNLTAVAANQPSVMLRFQFDGDYYFWQIDDIRVFSAPAVHDMSILHVYDNQYSQVPLVHADSVFYFVDFQSPGDYNETNVTAAVSTQRGATSVFTGLSSPVSTAIGLDSFLQVNGGYVPNQMGNYSSTFGLNYASSGSDVTPANNTGTYAYQVTSTTYAYDDGAVDNGYFLYNPAATTPADRILGNTYDIVAQDTISEVGIYMYGGTNGTATGTQIQGVVYLFDATSSTYSEVCRTATKTLAASDMYSGSGAPVLVKLAMDNTTGSPILAPGTYFIAVQQLSTTKAVIASSLASQWSRILTFDPTDNKVKFYGGTDGTSVMVRGYFSNYPANWGVNKIEEEKVGNAYPNPAKSGTMVTVPVSSKVARATVKVYNTSGQQVINTTYTVGNKNIQLSTTGLAEGVYSYTVESTDAATTNGKFTIVK